MHPATQLSPQTDISNIPTARFDAQDPILIRELREIFLSFGCIEKTHVFHGGDSTYWIVSGDVEYVKQILDTGKDSRAKILAIVYEGEVPEEVKRRHQSMKIVYTDPVIFSEVFIKEILSFFFTSSQQYINNRKRQYSQKQPRVTPTLPRREIVAVDVPDDTQERRRIDTMFSDVYKDANVKANTNALHKWKRIIIAFLVVFMMPTILYVTSIIACVGFLYGYAKFFRSHNEYMARSFLPYAEKAKATADFSFTVVRYQFFLLPADYIHLQESLLSVLSNTLHVLSYVDAVTSKGKDIAHRITDPTADTVSITDVVSFRSLLTAVSQEVSLISAEIPIVCSERNPFQIFPHVQSLCANGKEAISFVSESLLSFDHFLSIYPYVGGFRFPQTYLLVLQNSMELRPSGGFIGGVILLTMESGKISSFEVKDVYELDGQLKGHVDPPAAIRDLIGQEHWYLRDSNWSQDFQESGKQIAWFYEKESGKKVDGVIGISLPVVTSLLRQLGTIDLADFSDRISADNFFAKSLVYTQSDFFPGSTQKKDFLSSLSTALLYKLTQDTTTPIEKSLLAISASLNSKDVQVYIPDEVVHDAIAQWGWSGRVQTSSQCENAVTESCTRVPIGIFEANLGVNKVNYYVTRDVEDTVKITNDGSIERTVRLTLHNSSSTDSPGGGQYLSYIRFILPEYTWVQSITSGGGAVAERIYAQRGPSVLPYWQMENFNGSSVFAVAISVPPGETQTVVLSTVTKQKKAVDAYEWQFFKQSGVAPYTWNFTLQYPEGWQKSHETKLANQMNGQYNIQLSKDTVLLTQFLR